MGLVVKKFGGTSVADLERIQRIAGRVLEQQRRGDQVVVVLSAMAGETNRLVALAQELMSIPDGREYDVLVSTGEQVTVALLVLAIKARGGEAVSLLNHQVKILTDAAYTKARIRHIDDARIREELQSGRIVVIPGFQGIDDAGNVTTLGRGGSDTTAVALAAALKAEACEIFTDVDGVYTTDPNLVPEARKIERISYEEMLEMASTGSKVLQIRSVELAAKFRVPLYVRSSFQDVSGTLVTAEDMQMESQMVTGVSLDRNEAKIALREVPDRPGVASQIFAALAEAHINVDMIVQNVSSEGTTDLTFTAPKADLPKALQVIEPVARQLQAGRVESSVDIAKVSLIGLGMRSHAGVASQMFAALAAEGINIQMISTSEIKISIIIQAKYAELAVRVLHESFGLGKK